MKFLMNTDRVIEEIKRTIEILKLKKDLDS